MHPAIWHATGGKNPDGTPLNLEYRPKSVEVLLKEYFRNRHCPYCILSGNPNDGCNPEKHPKSWIQGELEFMIKPDKDF